LCCYQVVIFGICCSFAGGQAAIITGISALSLVIEQVFDWLSRGRALKGFLTEFLTDRILPELKINVGPVCYLSSGLLPLAALQDR
jgi:hypothetical protein